jgi:hypothetical protein
MFDCLASFPGLRSLEVWFELGLNPPLQPYLTTSSAAEIYTHFRNQRQSQERHVLQSLHLHSGDPGPAGLWKRDVDYMWLDPNSTSFVCKPGEYYAWPQANSTSFVCKPTERDDDAARGCFRVLCTRLNDEENVRAERILQGVENLSPKDPRITAITVALYGPMPVAEWVAAEKYLKSLPVRE